MRLHHVIIKTDAEYVTKGLNDFVWKWEDKGYTNAKGQPVVNLALFQAIQRDIEWVKARDVQVDFWLVPREDVEAANCLANAALDRLSASYSVELCERFQLPFSGLNWT